MNMAMQRIPEPELMDDPQQARAYAEADFSEANQLFLDLYEQCFAGCVPHHVLDIGCGPGAITLDFAARHSQCHITGIDGAGAMLDLARRNLRQHPDLNGRVDFQRVHLPSIEPPRRFDTIISNSLLHHLPDPSILWQAIQKWGRQDAAVLVMDLIRPPFPSLAEKIVARHAPGAPAILQRDFFNSLCAAFTLEEIKMQLSASGLEGFEVISVNGYHLAVFGALK